MTRHGIAGRSGHGVPRPWKSAASAAGAGQSIRGLARLSEPFVPQGLFSTTVPRVVRRLPGEIREADTPRLDGSIPGAEHPNHDAMQEEPSPMPSSSLFDLSGKVAIVTGGSRGIGRAICERMAEHGAKVVVSSRKLDACQAVVDAIKTKGGEAVAVACNIGRKEELQRLADDTIGRWGGVDILVCNAAINPHFGPAMTMPDEIFDKMMATNVKSNLWLSHMCIPSMEQRGGGAIVIISSIGGYRGSVKLGAYAITKAADLQLARNLAVEWGPKNIRVNCIAPGLIRTDFARALWEDPVNYRKRTRDTPLQRIGEPDEIAGAAVFLASPAGSFTTGQSIVIDGGVLAGAPAVAEE